MIVEKYHRPDCVVDINGNLYIRRNCCFTFSEICLVRFDGELLTKYITEKTEDYLKKISKNV